MEQKLNDLIQKFEADINEITGNNESEIFSKFYNDNSIQIIQAWIDPVFNKKSIKDLYKSKLYRDEGNNYFKNSKNTMALVFYTKSLIYAPYNSVEFNLSMGNRSAALFHLGKYEDCIKDLKLCLNELTYPENKKFKLYHRLIQSYIDLKLGLEAKKVYLDLVKYLDTLTSFADEFDEKTILKLTEIAQNLNGLINIIIEEENLNPTKPTSQYLPKFSDDVNQKFPNASNLVALKYSDTKGRHVIAESDIKTGTILFIEKAIAFVPVLEEENPRNYQNVCYNCFKETFAPIPCENCEELFCSLNCRNVSWTSYHKYECYGSCSSKVWKNIGVNFLAFRIFLLGYESGYTIRETDTNLVQNDLIDWYVNKIGPLLSNIQKMSPEDILPHLVSTLIIVLYLKEKTNFYNDLRQSFETHLQKTDAEISKMLGGILLKHILQVIINASIIENVADDFYKIFNSESELKDSGLFVVGTGLYTSVAMMNHSCKSNVTNFFIRNTIIVKSNRDIAKGDEILNCYGHDCRSESTNDRKLNLKLQYYFSCNCVACSSPTEPEFFELGFSCPKCNNCSLKIPTKDVENIQCLECNHKFVVDEGAVTQVTNKIYQKWKLNNNVDNLEKCLELENQIYYKYNYKLYDLIQELQSYYKTTGRFSLWWKYAQMTLEMDKKIFGNYSLKFGLNLRESCIFLLKYLSQYSRIEPQIIKQKNDFMTEAKVMLNNSKDIFKLYYPENRLKYNYIHDLLKKVQIIISVDNFDV